jgi:hypothetical protein
MKRIQVLLAVLLLLGSLSGCRNDQVRFRHRMEGSWNIARETVILINPDGTTDLLVDDEDAGTLLLSEDALSDKFLIYTLRLNRSNFQWAPNSMKCDEERKRVMFYFFYCGDIFGCDMNATIEEDMPDRQVWSFFRPVGDGHRKVTWTLERE